MLKLKKGIRILQIILILVILFSGYRIYTQKQAEAQYDQEIQQVQAEKETIEEKIAEEKPGLSESEKAMNLVGEFKEEVPQVVAWITIPDTHIDFPVVQGTDNIFYLDQNFKGQAHPYGAIFLEMENKADFSDDNVMIYGHNVPNGGFFQDLLKYREQGFFEAHPTVILAREGAYDKFEIFAAYPAKADENFRQPSYSEGEKEEFFNRIRERNELNGDLPEGLKGILTLQTCIDNTDRFVVHAKKIVE